MSQTVTGARGRTRDASQLLGAAGWAAALALPGAAVVYLSFHAGGYFPDATGFVAIFFAQALVVRTMVAPHPFAGIDRRVAIPILGLALYAGWELASALWSHATARAIDEFDRTLLYLLAFLLFGSMAGTAERLRWLLRVLVAAIAVVCIIGLISRLLPGAWPTTLSFASNRLSYPLTYWNAEGILATIGLILSFHLTCDPGEYRAVRVVAAALIPAIASTLLLTFSRGALAAALIGIPVYLLLGRPRAMLTGAIAVVPTAAIALRSTYDATLLASTTPTSPAAIVQGHHVAALVGASVVLAAGLRLALLVADTWLAQVQQRHARAWRQTTRTTLGALAVVAVIVFFALGGPAFIGRQYTRFVKDTPPPTQLLRNRLTDAYNNNRLPLWRVGVHAFEAQPLRGQGAGTFQLYFARHRPNVAPVIDAHSLYVQTLAELGLVGFVLLLVALLGSFALLVVRLRGPDRAVHAAVLAAGLAWAIHSGFDWDWQMPAVTLWLFAAAGLALGHRGDRARVNDDTTWDRVSISVGWLAIAVLPFLVTLSFERAQSASQAMTNLNCGAAKRDALSSLSYLSARPEPYAVIGLCDLRDGFGPAGVIAAEDAVSREPNNWQYVYVLALARASEGKNPASTLQRAHRLDPHEPIIEEAAAEFRHAGPARWAGIAAGVSFQGLASGDLSDI